MTTTAASSKASSTVPSELPSAAAAQHPDSPPSPSPSPPPPPQPQHPPLLHQQHQLQQQQQPPPSHPPLPLPIPLGSTPPYYYFPPQSLQPPPPTPAFLHHHHQPYAATDQVEISTEELLASVDLLPEDELRLALRQALATLNDKENDLVIAASIGQQLLKSNRELVAEYDAVCQQLAAAGTPPRSNGEDVLRRSLNRTLTEALSEHPLRKFSASPLDPSTASPSSRSLSGKSTTGPGGDKLSTKSQRNLKYIAKLEQDNMELTTSVATLTAELKLVKVSNRKFRRQIEELKKNAESAAELEEASTVSGISASNRSRLRKSATASTESLRARRGLAHDSDLGDLSSSGPGSRRDESKELRQLRMRLTETERQLVLTMSALEDSERKGKQLEELKNHNEVLVEKLQRDLLELQDVVEEERRLFAASFAGVIPGGVSGIPGGVIANGMNAESLLPPPPDFMNEVDSTAPESDAESVTKVSTFRTLRSSSSASSLLKLGDSPSRRISITFRRKQKSEKAALIFDRVIGTVNPNAAPSLGLYDASIVNAMGGGVGGPDPLRPMSTSPSPSLEDPATAAESDAEPAGTALANNLTGRGPSPSPAITIPGRSAGGVGGGGGGLLSPLAGNRYGIPLGLAYFSAARERVLAREAGLQQQPTTVPISNFLRTSARLMAAAPVSSSPTAATAAAATAGAGAFSRPLGALRGSVSTVSLSSSSSTAAAAVASTAPPQAPPIAPPSGLDDEAATALTATTAALDESESSETSDDGGTGSNLLDRLFRKWVGLATTAPVTPTAAPAAL